MIILSIFACNICVLCQEQGNTDSLENIINTLSGTEKIDVMNKLAYEYHSLEPEKSIRYSRQALLLSEKEEYPKGKGQALNNIGLYYAGQSEYKKALIYYKRSFKQNIRIKNIKGITNLLNNIGTVYYARSDYNISMKYYEIALSISKMIKYDKGMAMLFNNMANIYHRQGDSKTSMKYHQKALYYYEKIDNKLGIAGCYNNIGLVYKSLDNNEKAKENYLKSLEIYKLIKNPFRESAPLNNLALIFQEEEDYERALLYHNKARKNRENAGDKKGLSGSLNNIGNIYKTLDDYDPAMEYYYRSYRMSESIGDKQGKAIAVSNIGEMNRLLKNYQKAIEFMSQSIEIAEDINEIGIMLSSYSMMSDIYNDMGQAQKALEYYDRYIAINDSVYNEDVHQQISELQARYETEKKQHQINMLKKKNEIQTLHLKQNRIALTGLFVMILFLIIMIYIIYRQYRLRSRENILNLEQKLLRSQMNPHFIFNSLTAIQSYMMENDIPGSEKYISDFANLMRLILENSKEEYVILERETETLRYYLELQQIRFDNSFDYKIHIDNKIDMKSVAIPPMLAQPFIENAIEHGLADMDNNGMIDIGFVIENGKILFSVEDNGMGIEKAQEMKNDTNNRHKSLATVITRERLDVINRVYKQKISLEITDMKYIDKNRQGTRVTFFIPYRNV